jgi:hypothetical protein
MRSHEYTESVKTQLGEKYPFDYAAKLFLDRFDFSEQLIEKLLETSEAPQPEKKKS